MPYYRLSENQKNKIAQNLIDILQKDADITKQTINFIDNWIRDQSGARKVFFDVWDIVLRNYVPTTSPILFRGCKKVTKNGKISSFTGRLDCAIKFAKPGGYLIICDTEGISQFQEQHGEYKHTFYPLVSVLKKAKDSGWCGFSERTLKHIVEDEYIMRINFDYMKYVKYIKNDL